MEWKMAGRPRKIDRNAVLDAAEALVLEAGAGALSFDALARAAGVTKGGVQYAFGTKEGLIRAMIARWTDEFDAAVAAHGGPEADPRARIRAHLAATRDTDAAEHSRSAVMMTALVQQPEQLAETRAWYSTRLAGLDLTQPAARRLALAFLAGEGAFLLRAFGLMELSEAEWDSLFAEMMALAQDPDAAG
jgi:AcrR family transcriptional regulator